MDLVMTVTTALISSTVGAIVGALVSKIKTVRRESERAKRDSENLTHMMTQNILMTCRLVIYSDKFDVDEKIEAYKTYVSYGGNHQTKTYMDTLVGRDIDEYIVKHNI